MIGFDPIGLCRATAYDPDGILTFQPEYMGDAQSGSTGENGSGPPLAPLLPYGLIARPRDPDVDEAGAPTNGAGLLHVFDGDEGFALPLADARALTRLPQIAKGSVGLYADTDTAAILRLLLDASAKRFTVTSPSGTEMSLEDDLIKLGGSKKIGRVGDRVSVGTLTIAPVPSGPPGLVFTYAPPPSSADPSPVPVVVTVLGLLTLQPSPITIEIKGTIQEGSDVARAG